MNDRRVYLYNYYCTDYTKIENYDKMMNDKYNKWECHHRLETHYSNGEPRPINERLSHKDLIAQDLYYHRPPEELIFLTVKEHSDLHKLNVKHPHKGGFQSLEKRQKIAKARSKSVMCVETGEVFPSIKSTGLSQVSQAIKYGTSAGGYHWVYA